jgi:hypothetical protein
VRAGGSASPGGGPPGSDGTGTGTVQPSLAPIMISATSGLKVVTMRSKLARSFDELVPGTPRLSTSMGGSSECAFHCRCNCAG